MDTQQNYDNVEYASPYNFLGHRFGKLVSLGLVNGRKKKGRIYSVLFKCDCGHHRKIAIKTIREKGIQYEGCKRCQKTIPKDAPEPDKIKLKPPKTSLRLRHKSEYRTWCRDKSRLCARWKKSFKHFIEDMGPRPEGKVLCKRHKNHLHGPSVSYWGTPSDRNSSRFLESDGMLFRSHEFAMRYNIPLKFVEYHFYEHNRDASEIKWRWRDAVVSGRAAEYNNQK